MAKQITYSEEARGALGDATPLGRGKAPGDGDASVQKALFAHQIGQLTT